MLAMLFGAASKYTTTWPPPFGEGTRMSFGAARCPVRCPSVPENPRARARARLRHRHPRSRALRGGEADLAGGARREPPPEPHLAESQEPAGASDPPNQ